MDLNLFHLLVEDSDTPTVPSDPDLVADEFGRNFVISACHFDVTVAMDSALGFLEAGKERLGQCLLQSHLGREKALEGGARNAGIRYRTVHQAPYVLLAA